MSAFLSIQSRPASQFSRFYGYYTYDMMKYVDQAQIVLCGGDPGVVSKDIHEGHIPVFFGQMRHDDRIMESETWDMHGYGPVTRPGLPELWTPTTLKKQSPVKSTAQACVWDVQEESTLICPRKRTY